MKKILTGIVLFVCVTSFAQKMKLKQGDFNFIKGQKEINVDFVYDNMKLMKENITNDEYVANRSAELEEKSRGKGATWEKSWYASRELIWAPKFLELMNKNLEGEGISFAEDLGDTKYSLIVDTIWVYPGWDAGFMKQPAKVTTELRFVETANKQNVLAVVTSEEAPGDQWGNNFSNESRMGEGYAKTGKSLAKLIAKEAF